MFVFFFKQKTAYGRRISDWSSDVCSSDLRAMLRWTLAMLRNCTAARYALNKSRMVRLAEYSRDELIALRGQLGLDYDQRSQGTLQLFRTQKDRKSTRLNSSH